MIDQTMSGIVYIRGLDGTLIWREEVIDRAGRVVEHSIGTGRLARWNWLTEVDRDRIPAYLETDSGANLRFYERAGFESVGETSVLGVRAWLMQRPPADRRRNN